ncbi:hypothetical protein V5O48_016973 [Marasmius crinis-equi]|uniref:Uncharacterized protein n=1 Tax=Marasmius crinis-equi TaxID=585013 RepID=A0ABR3EQ91_9AGAR
MDADLTNVNQRFVIGISIRRNHPFISCYTIKLSTFAAQQEKQLLGRISELDSQINAAQIEREEFPRELVKEVQEVRSTIPQISLNQFFAPPSSTVKSRAYLLRYVQHGEELRRDQIQPLANYEKKKLLEVSMAIPSLIGSER